jgi:hypothetical protein
MQECFHPFGVVTIDADGLKTCGHDLVHGHVEVGNLESQMVAARTI